jgi:two-component system, response regulator PdtaR
MTTQHPKLLVVEDEGIVALDLQERLVGLGYEVLAIVPSAEEALDAVEKENPDLALMDICLKGEIDGTLLAARFRMEYDIPVIFLTAYSTDPILCRAKMAAPYGYLLKPYSERELKTNIEMALHHHALALEQARELRALQKRLETNHSLNGLLPICASCKKIRNSAGGWQGIEQYITEHSGASFTHGICPDCYKSFFKRESPTTD